MTSRRLVLTLTLALLIPVAAAAAPPAPSAAPAFSLPWLAAETACTATDAGATPATPEGVHAPGAPALPDTPFARREEKGGFCPAGSCDQFCADLCCGVPYGQCLRYQDGTCRAICWCYC